MHLPGGNLLLIFKGFLSFHFETIKHAIGIKTPVMKDCIPLEERAKCIMISRLHVLIWILIISISFLVFREEYKKTLSSDTALIKAISSTGIALFASAISSIVGFVIMAFAPMPLFATYGLLTACMILYAFLASIVILPLLLKWTHK